MATYLEKKREAIGFELPPADPFAAISEFDIPMSMGTMQGSGYITNFDKQLKEQINEQTRLKTTLEFKWDKEYTADKKSAHKNLYKLSEYLSANESIKIAQLFKNQPAADWLNLIFLEETEIDSLMDLIKKSSSECRTTIATTIDKELRRLVNFKTLPEKMLEETSL